MKRLAAVSTVLVALLFVAGVAGADPIPVNITNPGFDSSLGGWLFNSDEAVLDLGLEWLVTPSGYSPFSAEFGEFGLIDGNLNQDSNAQLFALSDPFNVLGGKEITVGFLYDFISVDTSASLDDEFFLNIIFNDNFSQPFQTTFRLFSSSGSRLPDVYDPENYVNGDPIAPSVSFPPSFRVGVGIQSPTYATTARLYFGLTEYFVEDPNTFFDLTDSVVAIDEIAVAVADVQVPEPSTLLLLAGGLAGLAAFRRRMR